MKKRYIILISIVLIIVAFFFVVLNYPKAEPEILLIPKSYLGEVIVIFNQENGQKIEYEDKNRIYRIPNTGILFTQFSYNPGVINQEYYFIDSLGNKSEIEYRPFIDSRDKYINEPERIGIHKLLTEFYGNDSCTLKTLQYYVGNQYTFSEMSCSKRMIEIVDTICFD